METYISMNQNQDIVVNRLEAIIETSKVCYVLESLLFELKLESYKFYKSNLMANLKKLKALPTNVNDIVIYLSAVLAMIGLLISGCLLEIYEPGLTELLLSTFISGYFKFVLVVMCGILFFTFYHLIKGFVHRLLGLNKLIVQLRHTGNSIFNPIAVIRAIWLNHKWYRQQKKELIKQLYDSISLIDAQLAKSKNLFLNLVSLSPVVDLRLTDYKHNEIAYIQLKKLFGIGDQSENVDTIYSGCSSSDLVDYLLNAIYNIGGKDELLHYMSYISLNESIYSKCLE